MKYVFVMILAVILCFGASQAQEPTKKDEKKKDDKKQYDVS